MQDYLSNRSDGSFPPLFWALDYIEILRLKRQAEGEIKSFD